MSLSCAITTQQVPTQDTKSKTYHQVINGAPSSSFKNNTIPMSEFKDKYRTRKASPGEEACQSRSWWFDGRSQFSVHLRRCHRCVENPHCGVQPHGRHRLVERPPKENILTLHHRYRQCCHHPAQLMGLFRGWGRTRHPRMITMDRTQSAHVDPAKRNTGEPPGMAMEVGDGDDIMPS